MRFFKRRPGSGTHVPGMSLMLLTWIVTGSGSQQPAVVRMRTDLLIVWPISDADKVRTAVLTTRCGWGSGRRASMGCAATEGHLVIFDRREDRSWPEKLYRRDEAEGGAGSRCGECDRTCLT